MKKISLLFVLATAIISCNNDDDSGIITQNTDVTISFTQNFDGEEITTSNFDNTEYINANGDVMTFTRLRYLITDVAFTSQSGTVVSPSQDYLLVNSSEGTGLSFNSTTIPEGTYSLTMRFGFTEAENTSNAYADLNAASWNVPDPMGGGYHYQQLDGKFINDAGIESPFNFHTISAPTDAMTENVTREDTSIAINLGTVTVEGNTTTIEVKANIAEWFKNPNTWDLNEFNTMLMGNNAAQLLMEANGQDVFTLGTVN